MQSLNRSNSERPCCIQWHFPSPGVQIVLVGWFSLERVKMVAYVWCGKHCGFVSSETSPMVFTVCSLCYQLFLYAILVCFPSAEFYCL